MGSLQKQDIRPERAPTRLLDSCTESTRIALACVRS